MEQQAVSRSMLQLVLEGVVPRYMLSADMGEPTPWHKTKCLKFLKQDMNKEKHLTMYPREMYNDLERKAQKDFSLSTF